VTTPATNQAERILNLLAFLTETSTFLTQAQIRSAMGPSQYADGDAGRATFERDKSLLREMGIPIEMITLQGNQAGEAAYRIDRRQMELSRIDFTDEERRALQLALAAVHIDTAWADHARLKLGVAEVDNDAAVVSQAMLPVQSDVLPVLASAAQSRNTIEFSYRGENRSLDPYGVLGRGGYWYVVGHDNVRQAVRSFRVDRIDGKVKVLDTTFERPADFDVQAAVATDAQMLGEGESSELARVVIGSRLAPSVLREFGSQAVVETRDNGDVVVEVPCGNRSAFRSWVLGLVDEAEVLSPPEARADIIGWLTSMAGTS
jgi:predicted DNA-binding transcriptional regulator YafY